MTILTYRMYLQDGPLEINVKRRNFIAIAGTGAASIGGCIGKSTDAGAPTTNNDSSKTAQNTMTVNGLRITNESLPDEVQVTAEARPLQSFSTEHPARISISFTNTSEKVREFKFGPTPPFSQYGGQLVNGDAKLIIIPKNEKYLGYEGSEEQTESGESHFIPQSPDNGCWRSKREPIVMTVAKNIELASNESITMKYTVLAHPDNNPCIPKGRYRFKNANYVDNDSWGFEIHTEQ